MSSDGSPSTTSKQAACLNCRKSKIKCKRSRDSQLCERCEQSGTECIIPNLHVGRQKGVKNKRTGLGKAIHQIEEAIKKSKSDTPANERGISELQRLLDQARSSLPPTKGPTSPLPTDQSGDDQLALDDAENPLQLLARASDLRLPTPQTSERDGTFDIHRFFIPIKSSLDVDETDPIELGLVTVEEAEMLVSFFHERLAHTRWGLDAFIHTLPFMKSRSSFLFTSILAAAALFLPAAAALAKRLSIHCKNLAHQVITRRLRSVEIVLAFMVNVPWMHPGRHSADDDTGLYISTALSIALDLSLNKIAIPSAVFEDELLKRTPKSDCIDARKALDMDGFEHVDPSSEWGQRLLRRRERAWIALFVLERGVCLARGRSYSVQITPLIKYCDKWHTAAIADSRDGSLTSMAVLRRDLDDLFSAVRSRCNGYRVIDVGEKVAREIKASIESFYDTWLATWTMAIGEGEHRILPPYVEILVTHTRLSTYSGVINHPTAPLEVKRLFRASALSSALNVMRAAIQGESRLQSMPNNTAIMICFAACIAFNLSKPSPGENVNLAPSVKNLIEETAAVLERIGSTPSHRNGMSILYGKYLREIITRPLEPAPVQMPESTFIAPNPPPNLWGEPLQFSTMSDNEIIETVLHADPGFNANEFMWIDWMNPPEFGFQ